LEFDIKRYVDQTQYGRQDREYKSPHWYISGTTTLIGEDNIHAFEQYVHRDDGIFVSEIIDPRSNFPRYFNNMRHNKLFIQNMSDVTVTATNRSDSTITVAGSAGDRILSGDALEFDHGNIRHYYKANQDLILTGSAQVLSVRLRPRVTLTSISHVIRRIDARQRFRISTSIGNRASTSDNAYYASIEGVEYFGEIS
jgi:hypothetical protein